MFINPFEEAELTSLSSGIIQTEKALTDLMEAEKIGEKELVNFQQERLYSDEVNFYDPIKKLKLGTFSKLITKAVKIKSSGKIAQFSVQSNIFGKICFDTTIPTIKFKRSFLLSSWSFSLVTCEL